MTWKIPNGYSYTVYAEMLKANHLLIAGCQGSGKSVVLNGILREIMQLDAPCNKKVILLDPKRVDFAEYKYSKEPHIIKYANDIEGMMDALDYALDIMEKRYRYMEKNRLKKYDGADIYVIIDEYADLHDVGGKAVETKVIRLCQLARAAKIHIVLATQRAVSCVSTRIRANMDCRLALHTINKKESVNIIDIPGAETLPHYGYGIYQTPYGYNKVKLPFIEDAETNKLIRWWTSPFCKE